MPLSGAGLRRDYRKNCGEIPARKKYVHAHGAAAQRTGSFPDLTGLGLHRTLRQPWRIRSSYRKPVGASAGRPAHTATSASSPPPSLYTASAISFPET